MSFKLENNYNNEVNETAEEPVVSDNVAETDDTTENYDDCSIDETSDPEGMETDSEVSAETDESFDDCEKTGIEDEGSTESDSEEYDDFSDCGKEEIEQSDEVNEDTEDVEAETDEVNEDTEDVEAETDEVNEDTEDAEDEADEVDEDTEDVETETDEVDEDTEDVEAETDEVNEDTEDVEAETDEVDEGTETEADEVDEEPEDVEAESDEVDEDTEDVEAETDEVNEDTEDVEAEAYEVDEEPEDVEAESDEVDEDTEDVETETDEVDEDTEDAEAEAEEVDEDTEDDSEEVNDNNEETDDDDETDEDDSEADAVEGNADEVTEVDDEDEDAEDNDESDAEGQSDANQEGNGSSGSEGARMETGDDTVKDADEAAGDETNDASDGTADEINDENTPYETSEIDEKNDGAAEVEREDLEQMENDEEIEASKIDEESIGEDVSEKVEEETDVELSDETKEKIEEEVADEIDSESDGDTITAGETEEIVEAEETKTAEEIEEVSEEQDEAIEEEADELMEEDGITKEEAEEQIAEEVSEVESEEISNDDVEEMAEDKSEEIEDAVDEKAEEQAVAEAADETVEEFEDEQEEHNAEQEKQSLQERIDDALDKEDASPAEINDLLDEHKNAIEAKWDERNAIEADLKTKFDEVSSMKRGTDEYREALKEYNELHDKKNEIDEDLAAMVKQQDVLIKKEADLRTAILNKGSAAEIASIKTLNDVDALQDRFDRSYYADKINKSEFKDIREDNCFAIKEMISEKESIKNAMDVKMGEIEKYVYANNMGMDDTARDEHYQQMLAEYNAMKENYDKLNYSIVKLDENNKDITEQLGDEYVSMVDRPPKSKISEVNEGTDVPGETNYFIDETKAEEVLSSFNQERWEQLSLEEQKQAVSRLAEYNTEILGLEDPPRIVYYNTEDPSDFGGYSSSQNAIYINEYNMKDAAETADTISHELRHKYQHERADKLENERDLEYRDGFDNYVRAEDDYYSYKEQLVESDARAYAQVVKDQIAVYSETDSGNKAPGFASDEVGKDYRKLNPEKGAVFEKISASELPSDFEQKDRLKYKECLEEKELQELKQSADIHYQNGKENWSKLGLQSMESYKEHNDLEHGHIENVRVKSLEAADSLEAKFSVNDYDGLYSPKIDRRTLEVMAIYHDTGMDGNIKTEDYYSEREKFINNEEKRSEYVQRAVDKKRNEAKEKHRPFDEAEAKLKANDKFEKQAYEEHFRSDHSLESAIHALRDREAISKLGVDPDEVALGCLVHSKSNSGLKNIASETEWNTAIERLEKRVDEYNLEHPNEKISFDSSFLKTDENTFNKEKLAEMRSEALALRIGDANGHDTNSRMAQNGKPIEFSLEKKSVDDGILRDAESKAVHEERKKYFLEVQYADVRVGGVELNNVNDPEGVSRMFAVGEGNFRSLSCVTDGSGNVKQIFDLCDGNAFPISTQNCILERLGEFETGKPMEYTPVVILGPHCSDEAYESYKEFAVLIKENYKVEMELKI